MQSIDEIIEYLKSNLSEKRFLHTMGVAETAKDLATRWGVEPSKAYIAGLVHDCAKEVPFVKTIELLEKSGVALSLIEKSTPGILHAPLGAILAKEIFGIDDEEILCAVKFHTTGRENMSGLEKIIYIADFIEPNRRYSESAEVRELAKTDIDKAALKETDMVIKFNIAKGKMLHPETIHTRNYLLRVINEGKQNES
ncbi:MAG: bis(5'-nucleosyl)-tetraphosphatase (symmetrical) YqeK [Clostridia bacterium]|nr:bis(5'-nucleosyl)-tetraphosphatase (symmetrical) YqeK [Clostridia bacterium]